MGTTDFPKNRALPAERPLELVVPLTVETTDLDYAGIVSNITYIRWLEYLRNRFFARYADPLAWFRDHIAAAVAETHILYLRPVGPSTALTGRIWLMEARHVDARLGAAITDSDLTPTPLPRNGWSPRTGRPCDPSGYRKPWSRRGKHTGESPWRAEP